MDHLLKILTKPDNVPIIIMVVLVAYYSWRAFAQARRNDKQIAPDEARLGDKIQVWPYLVKVEFIAAVLVTFLLVIWSVGIDAPLEEPANPALTPNPSKAPWYFLGLQEMLVYFDPWIAGVVLPGLIIFGLIVIPFIDINENGNGYYTWKERKFSIATFCFGFIVLWVSLIVVGTFLRGPGWNFFMPWEYWDTHKVVPLTNVDLFEYFGIPTYDLHNNLNPVQAVLGSLLIMVYYGTALFYWRKKQSTPLMKKLGVIRYGITAFLFLTMMALPIKMVLRIGFNVKYILVTPFFNI